MVIYSRSVRPNKYVTMQYFKLSGGHDQPSPRNSEAMADRHCLAHQNENKWEDHALSWPKTKRTMILF